MHCIKLLALLHLFFIIIMILWVSKDIFALFLGIKSLQLPVLEFRERDEIRGTKLPLSTLGVVQRLRLS
jgi:hypothetical protein